MDTLGELTDGHRRQIAAYREKWKAIGLLTERVDRPRVEAALEALFREIEFQASRDRLLFSSPAAAWADFPAWFPRIGRCLVAFWSYQLPLFDPQSFWRRFGGNRNRLIEPDEEVGRTTGEIACRERLGGLLRYYYRKVA